MKLAFETLSEFPGVQQLTLKDRHWVSGLIDEYPDRISEMTFGSFYTWRHYGQWSLVSRLGDHLLAPWKKMAWGGRCWLPLGPIPPR